MKLFQSKSFWITCGVINAACLVVLLLFLAVMLPSFGMWFYYWQFNVNDTYNVVNMQPHDLHEVTRHMLNYMRGFEEREMGLQITAYIGGLPRNFFSPIEIRHMVDVYDLFAIGFIIRNVAVILLAVTTLLFGVFGRRRLKHLFKSWLVAPIAVVALLATPAAFIVVDWHGAFVIFHEIFFDNDYWILDSRVDLLVNIVPYDFFITLSIVIGIIFAAGLVIISTSAAIILKKRKRRLGLAVLILVTAIIGLMSLEIFGITLLIILYVLLGLLGLLLITLAIALFCRIRYEVTVKKADIDAPWQYKARVIWLWGLLRKEFTPSDIPKATKKSPVGDAALGVPSPTPQATRTPDKSNTSDTPTPTKSRQIPNLTTLRAIIKHSITLIKKVFAVCRPKTCAIKAIFGAEEPHITGAILGAAYAAAPMLGIDAQLEGDFENKALQLDIYVSGQLRLFSLVLPTAAFVLKPEIRSLLFKRKPKPKRR